MAKFGEFGEIFAGPAKRGGERTWAESADDDGEEVESSSARTHSASFMCTNVCSACSK